MMKNLLIIFLSLGVMISCTGNTPKSNLETKLEDSLVQSEAVIEFDKRTHDFHQIFSGEKVSYAFRFTNTGRAPLLITGVRSGCGCTVGDYTKDPVNPGEHGKITVVFNSAGRKGFQSQSVNVLNNSSESPITLQISAEVLEQ